MVPVIDGIHFTIMKRQPDAAGNRYVTYDYWDLDFGLFFGNQSITEAQATGWGRVINGHNDEVHIYLSMVVESFMARC